MNVGHPQEIVLEHRPIGSMRVDREVQRQLDGNRANEIASNFNPTGFGIITVSVRKDGSTYIVDGQHRIAALRLMGVGDDHLVQCEVFTGLAKSDEAALFRVRNAFKQIRVYDRFRVRVIEGDPVAVVLNNALERYGWHMPASGPSKTKGAFNAVAAIEWVYRGAGIRKSTVHPTETDNTLGVITGAWGHNSDGVRAEIVRGIGLFLVQYGNQVDLAKIITELNILEGGPGALISKARSLNSFKGGGVASSVAEILVTMHNKGRRINVLPEWQRHDSTRKKQPATKSK